MENNGIPETITDSQIGFDEMAKLKVIGVGGGGGNAVEHMITHGVDGVEFIAANTDSQALGRSNAHHRIQLGGSGLGAGARPDIGEQFANEAEVSIRQHLQGAQMVFVTAGLGGGTGTGAAPVIARIAKEMGILTVGVVTKPFDFEGGRRSRMADEGLKNLEKHVDSLIVVLNDKLLEVLSEDVTQEEAFAQANEVLRSAVGGIVNVIHVPGLINVDFEDVKTVMAQPGRAMMGTAECAGTNRAQKAAEDAIACPLLEGIDLSGANGILVLISASKSSLKLAETKVIMNSIKKYAHPDAQVIMGTANDDTLEDRLRVTVIATGLSTKSKPQLNLNQDEMPISRMDGRPGLGDHRAPQRTPGLLTPSEPMVAAASGWRNGAQQPSAPRPGSGPSVWRSNRDNMSQSIKDLSSGNMGDMETPAFLRKSSNH